LALHDDERSDADESPLQSRIEHANGYLGRQGWSDARPSQLDPAELQTIITEDGVFGDNSDVMPRESDARGGGFGHGGVGGGPKRWRTGDEEVTRTELHLDAVLFEDGLCVGPDEFGMFESVMKALDRQRRTAQEIVEALRNNASHGRLFEILRPLASRAGGEGGIGHPQLLWIFANRAIDDLVNKSGPELLARFELLAPFEPLAQPSPIRLHRPS
jgi:hypothetical protein